MPPRIQHKVVDGIELKRCGRCKDWKPLTNFPKYHGAWDGLNWLCRICQSLIQGHRPGRATASQECKDSNGYITVPVPSWFTGHRSKWGRVHRSIIVYCTTHGLTELPGDTTVHHKDRNRTNDDPDNLVLMQRSNHTLMHAEKRRHS